MNVEFVPDDVQGCGNWRINTHHHIGDCPPMKQGPTQFEFVNTSDEPVKLYFEQEGAWRPSNKPMIEPGQRQTSYDVAFTKTGHYQIRNECAEPLGEFHVTQDKQQVVWSGPTPQQADAPGDMPYPPQNLFWSIVLATAILLALIVYWICPSCLSPSSK